MANFSLNNVKLSLVHYINAWLLPFFGFVEEVSDEGMTPRDSESVYQFARKNVAYAYPSGVLNPSSVSIMTDGSVVNSSEYNINYIGGSVTFDDPPTGEITANYGRYTIKVVDSFPESEEFLASNLPMVSVDVESVDKSPFAVGVDSTWNQYSYYVDIFATNDPMRMSLMDCMTKGLRKWIPLVDFSSGGPLGYDGRMNMGFDMDSQFVAWMKNVGMPSAKKLNFGSVSDSERNRAIIRGEIKLIH